MREDAVMKKPEAAAALIHNALEAGIEASCVLMDTWFTNEPFIHAVPLVFTRFILLEWIRRKHNDDKTIAELFFVCCEDIQDMEYSTALRSLMSIFATGIRNGSIIIDETVRMQLIEWFVSQPSFIQSIFPKFMNGIDADKGDLSILQVVYCQ